MEKSISENKNYIVKLFLLCQLFIGLIKIEAASISVYTYCEHFAEARVELVSADGQKAQNFYSYLSLHNIFNDFSFSHPDISTSYKYVFVYYNNYLSNYYKVLKKNQICQVRLFGISNINNCIYPSDDEVPLYLS